jgi:hypothetical protein
MRLACCPALLPLFCNSFITGRHSLKITSRLQHSNTRSSDLASAHRLRRFLKRFLESRRNILMQLRSVVIPPIDWMLTVRRVLAF